MMFEQKWTAEMLAQCGFKTGPPDKMGVGGDWPPLAWALQTDRAEISVIIMAFASTDDALGVWRSQIHAGRTLRSKLNSMSHPVDVPDDIIDSFEALRHLQNLVLFPVVGSDRDGPNKVMSTLADLDRTDDSS